MSYPKFYPPIETTNPFLTYHDDFKYAVLDAYGRNDLIVTSNGLIYSCIDYINRFNHYSSLEEMLPYLKIVQNREISVGKNCKIYVKTSVRPNIIYNNYYKAPWYYKPKGKEDLLYYRLCDYERFKTLASFYYGTNYGDIWSTRNGSYMVSTENRPNKDGIGYRTYRTIADTESEKRNITGHWVSGYFVHNPKPNEYNTLCHKDNDPSNNYYKNLYWGTQSDNLQQARDEQRNYFKLDRITVEQILMERKEAIENGDYTNNIISAYAKKLNITVQAIYTAIKTFKLEHLFIEANDYTKKKSKIPLIYDNCNLANDYSSTGSYVVLRGFNRKDIIITNTFGIAYKCIGNIDEMDEIFQENDQSNWPSVDTLASMNILKRITSVGSLEKFQIRSSCEYLNTKYLTLKTLYNNYYNYSPWFIQKVLHNDKIHYVQMSTHSELSFLPDYYFFMNNGWIFSMYSGMMITPYEKENTNIKEYSLKGVNGKTITRSINALLEAFNFV